MTISNNLRGSLFILPLIPSVIVAIFNLYHLLINRALRTALNNHAIILLLCCGLVESLTDIPWQIYVYRNGVVLVSTPAFCTAWAFLSSSMYISIFILMAWASMERHILVFYPNWFRTKKNRLYLHYLPLATCIVYPVIFYFLFFIVLPCNAPIYYIFAECGLYACILRFHWTSLWDSIAHYIMPAFTTVIFSVALFVRVVYKRYRARGQIDWRNYKKMTAQLLPISVLYIAMQLPVMILYAGYSGGLSYRVGINYYSDGFYFTYWVVLLTPFATVISLPDLKTKCRNLLFWRRNRAVQPVAIEMARRNINQPGTTGMARAKVNQPTATEMASPKVHQPTTNEVASTNANQPAKTGMTPLNANQPTATEIASPSVHQPTGAAMTHHYSDQPVAVLPDVQ
jgi:hypothetical protein